MNKDAAITLNLQGLSCWLREKGVLVQGALSATRIGLGQSNLTYELCDDAGHRWVARRPPVGKLLHSAHDVAREHRILTALAGTAVPTPGVVGLVEDRGVCEAPLLVVEFVDGLVVDRISTAEQLLPEQRALVGKELASVLADLHAVDLDEVGLSGLASHSPYAERQLKRWIRQWEASRTRDLPALDSVTQWLTENIPAQTELVVVHGDLHIRNVILDPGSTRVRATLDWELCTLGDPLADLGTTLAYWPEPEDPSLGLFEASRLPGFATRREIADTYASSTGRDISDLRFWQVLGTWKIAVISEGVLRRALDEPLNAAEGGPPPVEVVDMLADRALTIARG